MTRIRVATNLDREYIRKIHMCAFPEGEKQMVSTLADNLLSGETSPKTISLVAEADGTVVGHIAFSPVTINSIKSWKGYILAPLGIKPEYQKRQIGSKLIEIGMAQLSKMGVNVLFVYGDPQYYSRFGFKTDLAKKFIPPHTLQFPEGWLALKLNSAIFPEGGSITCVDSLNDPELW